MLQLLSLLPSGVQYLIYIVTTIAVGAVAVLAFVDTKLAIIIGVGLAFILLAFLGFLLIRSLANKRRAASLSTELNQHSSNAPSGVSDAAGRAELDRLRQKFLEGISKFGGVENIYKFPWYVVVGEPGSGKTEAIRRCNVGFPPGMQDELQGTGGTINMNWWFTNQAVFLDTAGRMMFKDVAPGESSEWKEFLQLLSRNRPNCPINGLLLMIPADALIKDTDNKLNEKASRIAQQFEVIQRTLDIRFPVFVVVTKCDLLSGFREFFDDFADINSVNQMLGWSNQEDRDVPFAPDRVTDHIATVISRIKKRRLSILRDPVPRSGDRRADEVDALYALPQSFQLIAPRLRMYLEKIFVAGPWSPKPLFLRGIYFTSSMREGSALDQELAQALGITIDNLPEGKVWERERAYFLRDIFTEKIFRERGLVTRATNTKKMLRKRSLLLWGTASVLALAFVGFTIYAYQQFADSIKKHSDLWTAAMTKEDWAAKYGRWKPIVSPDKPTDTVVKFRGQEPPVKVGSKSVSLLDYHAMLSKVAGEPIQTPWVYSWIVRATQVESKRTQAQRIVFEASNIFPLADAARNRMETESLTASLDKDEPIDDRFDREAKALQALLRIEADKVDPTRERKITELPEKVFVPLLQFATATPVPPPADVMNKFRGTLEATYSPNPNDSWVPANLDKGSATLASNKPIAAGLDRLVKLAETTMLKQRSAAEDVAKLRDHFRDFRKVEEDMNSIANGLSPMEEREAKLKEQLTKLASIKTEIDKKLESGLLDQRAPSMKSAYTQLVTNSKAQSGARFAELRDFLKPLLAHPTAKLFAEVDQKLIASQNSMEQGLKETFSEKDQEELESLDPYLSDYQESGMPSRVYAGRYATYKRVEEIASGKDALDDMIGSGWKTYTTTLNMMKDIENLIMSRKGDLSGAGAKSNGKPLPDFAGPCNLLLKVGTDRRKQSIAQAYLDQSIRAAQEKLFFPFVITREKAPGNWSQTTAKNVLLAWERDLNADPYTTLPDTVRARLSAIKENIGRMKKAPDDYAALEAENQKEIAREREERKNYGFEVSVEQQNVWKTANGKNIFSIPFGSSVSIGSFGADDKAVIRLSDPTQGSSASISVDINDVGTKTISGVKVRVETRGTKPRPAVIKRAEGANFSAPDKAEIIQKLQGSAS